MVLGTNNFPFYKLKFISIYQLVYERKNFIYTDDTYYNVQTIHS